MKNLINRSCLLKCVFVVSAFLLSYSAYADDPQLKNTIPLMYPFNIGNPEAFPIPDSYTMPDTLEFIKYWIQESRNGIPPEEVRLDPNIHKELPACIYSRSVIDQYGNPKIYLTCTATKIHNTRVYPPLYPGDVFPVLDQLYYFESSSKAIKVLEVKEYVENYTGKAVFTGQIILPLFPLEILPETNPFHPGFTFRASGLLRNIMGSVSLVKINERSERNPTLTAVIFTDVQGKVFIDVQGKVFTEDFQTKKEYRVGDVLINHYEEFNYREHNPKPIPMAVGFRLTKIVPPDPERKRVFTTVEGEKTGRLIGWVELDPTPIPIDENGNPIEETKQE